MQKIALPIGLQWACRLLFAVILFCTVTAFKGDQKAMPSSTTSNGWVHDKTVNEVEFYHQLINCNGKTVVVLKFNNKNNHKVKVSWKEVFTTQLEKSTEGYNGKKQLFIGPGETFASGCDDDKIKEILILPQQVKPTYAVSILGFEFKDINVSLVL